MVLHVFQRPLHCGSEKEHQFDEVIFLMWYSVVTCAGTPIKRYAGHLDQQRTEVSFKSILVFTKQFTA